MELIGKNIQLIESFFFQYVVPENTPMAPPLHPQGKSWEISKGGGRKRAEVYKEKYEGIKSGISRGREGGRRGIGYQYGKKCSS